MATFTSDEIEYLARLSRLALTHEERQAMTGELNAIVEYVNQLQEVATDGVEPMTHAVPMVQREREDVARDDVEGLRALTGSAGFRDGLVRVPRVVE